MNKNIFILAAIIFISGYMFCQDNLEEQYILAKDLYDKEKFFDAVTEFKRLIFFDNSGIYKAESEFYIGICYKKGGFYSEAIEHLASAKLVNKDEELAYKIRIEIIKNNILRRTIKNAFQEIAYLDTVVNDFEKKRELRTLRGFAHAFSEEWNAAAKCFRESGYYETAGLLAKTSGEIYSETKAQILSAIIPGAGQIYTGNYINGIISLGLNFLTGYLTIYSFSEDRIFDGVMTGNFLWFRFYSGGISNSAKFAREKNKEISDKTMLILQKFDKYRLN